MKHKCKIFWSVLIISGIFLLNGCFPEGEDGCPDDMCLTFVLEDEYEPGDFDSRIGNDVRLYIFKDKKLTTNMLIPYEDISKRTEFILRKTEETHGELFFVAWSVHIGSYLNLIPSWTVGNSLDDMQLALESRGRAEYSESISTDLYFGTLTSVEDIDTRTQHTVVLNHSACRFEVNISDHTKTMVNAKKNTVEVHGTMTRMNMYKKGIGEEAVVVEELTSLDEENLDYSTGRFGVLPSSDEQTVDIKLYADDNLLLTLPTNKKAEAGGLIIVDYILGETYFYITVDGFTEKIFIEQM